VIIDDLSKLIMRQMAILRYNVRQFKQKDFLLRYTKMEEEQQGCNPLITGTVVGMGCIVTLVAALLIGVFLISMMVVTA